MTARSFRRRLQLLDWKSILLCVIFALVSHNNNNNNSQVFATSFQSAPVRGGSSTVVNNPNGDIIKNGANRDKIVEQQQQQQQQQQQRGGGGSLNVIHKRNGGGHSNTAVDDDHLVVDAAYVAETNLPTDAGNFRLRAYRTAQSTTNKFVGNEPCVIYSARNPPFGSDGKLREGVPVRVHDQCLTSEVFGSNRCDCKEQLRMALDFVNENGGAVIYLQQEGRGIGLANKVAAYALQDGGMDTVDANLHLGFPEDSRQYGVIPSILRDMNIKSIQLMTNNPRKVSKLTFLGVKVEKTIPMVVPRANQHNVQYLETKQRRMNHSNFGDMLSRDLMPTQTNNGGMVPKKTTTIAETTYTSSSSLVKTRMPQNNGDTEH